MFLLQSKHQHGANRGTGLAESQKYNTLGFFMYSLSFLYTGFCHTALRRSRHEYSFPAPCHLFTYTDLTPVPSIVLTTIAELLTLFFSQMTIFF